MIYTEERLQRLLSLGAINAYGGGDGNDNDSGAGGGGSGSGDNDGSDGNDNGSSGGDNGGRGNDHDNGNSNTSGPDQGESRNPDGGKPNEEGGFSDGARDHDDLESQYASEFSETIHTEQQTAENQAREAERQANTLDGAMEAYARKMGLYEPTWADRTLDAVTKFTTKYGINNIFGPAVAKAAYTVGSLVNPTVGLVSALTGLYGVNKFSTTAAESMIESRNMDTVGQTTTAQDEAAEDRENRTQGNSSYGGPSPHGFSSAAGLANPLPTIGNGVNLPVDYVPVDYDTSMGVLPHIPIPEIDYVTQNPYEYGVNRPGG